MARWVKFFGDDTKESGSDQEIEAGVASWSKGRLDGISCVRLFNLFNVCVLKVPDTEWHQFDRFVVEANPGTHKPVRTHMVVQALLKEQHVGCLMVCDRGTSHRLRVEIKKKNGKRKFIKEITERDVGRWITLVAPSKGLPYVAFADKGRLHD